MADCNVVLQCLINIVTHVLRGSKQLGLLGLARAGSPLVFHTSRHVLDTSVHVATHGGRSVDLDGNRVNTPRLLRDIEDAEEIRFTVLQSVKGTGGEYVDTTTAAARALCEELKGSVSAAERQRAKFDHEDATVVTGAVLAARRTGRRILLVTEDRGLLSLGYAFSTYNVEIVNQAQLYRLLLRFAVGSFSQTVAAEYAKVA